MDLATALKILKEAVEKKWFRRSCGRCITDAVKTVIEYLEQTTQRTSDATATHLESISMEEILRIGTYILLHYTYRDDSGRRRCILCDQHVMEDPPEAFRHFRERHIDVLYRLIRYRRSQLA